MLWGDEDQVTKQPVDDAVGRIKSALPAVGHPAHRGVSKGVMMAGTPAGGRRARARLSARVHYGPPHAGCEQSGNGQDGQQSAWNAHGFCLLRIADCTNALR